MANQIMDILDNKTVSKSKNPCIRIAGILFKATNDAHITHLMQPDKTLAKHTAMSIFYEAMPDMIDTLVETAMAFYDVSNIEIEGSCKIEGCCIAYFEKLYNSIDMERKPVKESFLNSQIDTIQEEIAHAIYRLKYIQN